MDLRLYQCHYILDVKDVSSRFYQQLKHLLIWYLFLNRRTKGLISLQSILLVRSLNVHLTLCSSRLLYLKVNWKCFTPCHDRCLDGIVNDETTNKGWECVLIVSNNAPLFTASHRSKTCSGGNSKKTVVRPLFWLLLR